MSTPFDIGAQRFEYPFPKTQGSPTDTFMPLSSAMNTPPRASVSHWPTHVGNHFPLSSPPLFRTKPHPGLHSLHARKPPVPPGLAVRRAGLHHTTSEELGDKGGGRDRLPNHKEAPHSLPISTEGEKQRARLCNATPSTASESADVPKKETTHLSSDLTDAREVPMLGVHPSPPDGSAIPPMVSASVSSA